MIPAAAVTGLMFLPFGYEVDCGSWPAGAGGKVTVYFLARDGSELEAGLIKVGADADAAGALQETLVSPIEDTDWEVRRGPGRTVQVFAPKGGSIKAIRFVSDVWKDPKYRPVLRTKK